MEELARLETPDLPVHLRLQRVPRADGVMIWKLSAASVAAIPDLYQQYGYGLLGAVLPSVILETEFREIQLRQWLAIPVLVGFGRSSLDLTVFSYVTVTHFSEYLEVAEDLNLRIMDIVAAAGSSFAFTSQTTYIGKGSGLDAERVRAAEAHVQAWRERHELLLPCFTPEKIAEIEDTLVCPADGSATDTGAGR